jgi:hypothetical protein
MVTVLLLHKPVAVTIAATNFLPVIFRPRNTKSFHLKFTYPTKLALSAVCGFLPESRIPDTRLGCCNSLFFLMSLPKARKD